MGKKNQEVEPLFTPIKTTDDDDDDAAADVELATDGGPAVSYHDDPSQASSSSPSRRRGTNNKDDDDNGPAIRYRDEPVDNIFDWGSGSSGSGGGSKKEKGKKNSSEKKKQQKGGSNDRGDNEAGDGNDSLYQIDDFDPDATGFSPVSLHDTDDEEDSGDDDDDEENGNGSNNNGNNNSKDDRIRLKANKLLKQRVFDDTTYDDDDDDDEDHDRIFVGGGWGRHGSQFSCCPHGFCACCCRGNKPPSYSRGPPPQKKSKMKSGYSLCGAVCCGIAFLMLVTGSGYLGYEAGLPVEDVVDAVDAGDGSNETTSATTTTNDNTIQQHPHTKGEEWLEWLEREKDDIHMPHFNFTSSFHHKKHKKDDPSFKQPEFEPKTQSDLLHLSETIFQSCSERSLKTTQGRTACLSLCHGHYCCFEKDVEMGSCVSELNSYCFAYAACENVISDFDMDNANKPPQVDIRPVGQGHNSHDGMLNALDVKLLSDTCSVENIATIDGIRDCTAFCQHHLCCFNRLEEENCSSEFEGECQAYDACRILVEGPMGDDSDDLVDGTTSGQGVSGESGGGGGGGGGGALAPKNNNNGATAVVQPQPHSFKSDCMDSNLMENWDICKAHCSKFACCFWGTDSCYAENAVECDEYYICEEFFFDEEDQGALVAENKGKTAKQQQIMAMGNNNNNNNNNDVTSFDKDIETAVNAVCGLGRKTPGDDTWVTSCHTLCRDHLCCFATYGTQSNCRDSYGDDVCNAYQGCAVLHTVSSTSPAPNSNNGGAMATEDGNSDLADWYKTPEEREQEVKAVNEACVDKASRDPWLAEKCRKACDVRKCCYARAPGNCSEMNQDWCSEFVHCDVLY